jgi:hypothetical protein
MMAARIRYTTFRPGKQAGQHQQSHHAQQQLPSTQKAYTRDGLAVPAAQLIHRIISVPPASEAMKRADQQRFVLTDRRRARLAARNTAQAHRATRRQSDDSSTTMPGASPGSWRPVRRRTDSRSARRQLPFAGQLRRDRRRGHQNTRRNSGKNDDRRQQAQEPPARRLGKRFSVTGVLDIVVRAPVKKASPEDPPG